MKHTLKNVSIYSGGRVYVPGEEVDLPAAELAALGEVAAQPAEDAPEADAPAPRKRSAKE